MEFLCDLILGIIIGGVGVIVTSLIIVGGFNDYKPSRYIGNELFEENSEETIDMKI